MTIPRDAIGLSERLRNAAEDSKRFGAAAWVFEPMLEAATALDALQARVKELERDCAEAYQVVGTLAAAHRDLFSDPQVVKALDNLSAASSGDPRPHDDLLPFAPLSLDDPLAAAESRATCAEQERDSLEAQLDALSASHRDLASRLAAMGRERDEAYERAAGRWKPVGFGWGDIYEVSSLGHVRRIGSNALIGTVSGNGYVRVQLSRAGTTETFLTHKLVADAFIGPRPDGHHIDHINGVRDDNRFVNLRYCSPQQNISYTVERGANAVADRNGASVLTADQVRAIRQAKSEGGRYWGAARIAKELGVHESTVRKAASGKYYSALRIRRLAAWTEKEGK